ncbi:MAG: outer membrane lipoprotein-sorting protein [Desulfobacterales bacterium]|nr:outer membrane lipoprotein-sorting protein [Desulfobacterales bacterium]
MTGKRIVRIFSLLLAGLVLFLNVHSVSSQEVQKEIRDARVLIRGSYDLIRGKSSISLVEVHIHRPGWDRRFTVKAWTRGLDESLFFITEPARDRGNGTLKKGRQMWIYNPKVNRVIKLPPSMMSQSWMGSDFSNNDLARSDTLINDYTHTIVAIENQGGKKVYLIRSLPRPGAPVIWGQQELKIREDFILLSQIFFDEDLEPVKVMTTSEIVNLGGRLLPRVWRMQARDAEDEYTELIYRELEFVPSLAGRFFTLSRLRSPRR